MLICRLQQLCTWAVKPLEERLRHQQDTALAVEHAPLQTSRQVSKDADAAGPIYKHGQNNMMPNWHDRQQATKAEGFQSARHMTRYIKNQSQLAAHSVRLSSPDKVMEAYYSCMNQVCCQAEKQLNYVHINAIVHGTAKVWTAAEDRHSHWVAGAQAEQNLRSFIARMLWRLQPLLPAIGARLAANILWSSAKLGLDPDALVPGMTDSLAQQFMADMDAANGQEFATVLVACAKLQLNPCQGALLKAMCEQIIVADLSKFDSQNVANILHSLATLPAAEPSVELLDALCQRFDMLLNCCQAFNRPNELPSAQHIANTIWALSKLKYAPADELAMSMLYQALDWLRLPPSTATQQGKAWLNLEGKLGRLGARPAYDIYPHPGAQLVCSALTQLSLRVNCTPAISDYRIAAILEPAGSGAAIVVAFESSKCLMNKRSRLLGSEGFRQQLLSRRGKLFLLTPPKAGVGVKEVAENLEPSLTAAAGGSLDAYRWGEQP
ncbi:MAG: hypothetical protein FRX49_08578 [Trebouxia sp. A1-2]|nr:MAG: hypothetical protein FRX49_08578 [Trebouxia sp. A1-2]